MKFLELIRPFISFSYTWACKYVVPVALCYFRSFLCFRVSFPESTPMIDPRATVPFTMIQSIEEISCWAAVHRVVILPEWKRLFLLTSHPCLWESCYIAASYVLSICINNTVSFLDSNQFKNARNPASQKTEYIFRSYRSRDLILMTFQTHLVENFTADL